MTELPKNWHTLPLSALWDALNQPSQLGQTLS
jgi:hypothetical protein